MWSDFFKAGGFGMYPTLLFGFLLVGSAVLFLLRPERRFELLVASLGVVTLAAGLLGCSVGMIKSALYLGQVAEPDRLKILALGCAESLHDVVLALILIVVAGLVATVGALRVARGVAVAPGPTVAPRAAGE